MLLIIDLMYKQIQSDHLQDKKLIKGKYKMKKGILKTVYNLILICIMLSLVVLGIMGIVYNFNRKF